ncbi:P-loop containing nucleoside triphosphate hydrolase protein, partial [Jimgerdemannia flammicorona]
MKAKLDESLPGECGILALRGLGGIGKTQLMLHYYYNYNLSYKYVFWLEVDTWSAAVDSFRKLAINLGLDKDIIEEMSSVEEFIDWVRIWLQMNEDWILLLDNADCEVAKKVFKLLPCLGGDIILTTREHIPSSLATVIIVDRMKEKEALDLLLGVSSKDSVEGVDAKIHLAQQIITELDCMPLALHLARAYVNNTQNSLQHYLEKLKTQRKKLLMYNDEKASGEYNYSVATVWTLSLERIQSQSSAAAQILEACAFLQPDYIPVRFFEKQYSALRLEAFLSTNKQDEEQPWEAVRKAIAVLVDFSFVVRTHKEGKRPKDDPRRDFLTIPRLVQKVIYDSIDDKKKLRWAHNIATALKRETESVISHTQYDLRIRVIMEAYLSHIRHFATLLDDLSQNPLKSKDLHKLLIQVVDYRRRSGAYSGIEELALLSVRVSTE